MNKTSTLDEILLYTYGETYEKTDADAMENLLLIDELLNDEFQIFAGTRQIIDESMVNPPDSIVSKIIAYSDALTVLSLPEPDLRMMIKN